MCQFESLYMGDDGYVICCKGCGFYQLAFGSTALTLLKTDMENLAVIIKNKCGENEYPNCPHGKNIVLPTPHAGIKILLTLDEAKRLGEILEEADNEERALSLLRLFNE